LQSVRRAKRQQNPYINTSSKYVEYKVVMFGCVGVGRSALKVQFIHGTFHSVYDPTIDSKIVEKDGKKVILDILDTAGPEGKLCKPSQCYNLNIKKVMP